MNAAKKKSLSPAGLTALRVLLLLAAALFLPETRVWGFEAGPQHASGQIAFASASAVGEIASAWQYDASGSLVAAESAGARGLSQSGGIFTSSTTESGGTLWTSTGTIRQSDFGSMVNSGLFKGDVDIISGVHGFPDGTVVPDLSLFEADVAKFGHLDGVTVHNFLELTPEQLSGLLNTEGTTIGGFCNSGKVLGL